MTEQVTRVKKRVHGRGVVVVQRREGLSAVAGFVFPRTMGQWATLTQDGGLYVPVSGGQ